MVLPQLFKTRLVPLFDRLADAAEPALWIAGILTAAALAWWMTGWGLVAVTVGSCGMILAAWRLVGAVTQLRVKAADALRERAAMEAALRRSQKMEALGRLTVGVAHDFNNHLTAISSNVEMIARGLGAEQQRLLRHTDAALQGVRRAALVTGRLLSVSRQTAAEAEAVEVDRLVGGLVELLRRTLDERAELEVRLSGSPWFVWTDVNEMENALLSMVANVREQLPDGGLLSITVSNVQLDAVFAASHPTVAPGDYIQIGISGPAAPGEAEGWQAVEELSAAELFMAQDFVRGAGGYLLRSDPALGGLSLRLFLPRHVPPAIARVPHAGGGRMTILVVEDEAATRSACVETLRGLGYLVQEAPDAMEAFRLIADQGGIDLLFTDIGLPGGVSGRALADAARNIDPAMRILFTTGHDCADLPGWAIASLLRKPFSPAQLAAKVQNALSVEQKAEPSETVHG